MNIPQLLIPTPMHVANRFTMGMFEENFGPNVHKRICQQHINIYLPMLKEAEDPENVLVIPIRHPRAVAASHRDRRQDVDKVMREYRAMIDEYDRFKPFYLPIDSPHRDEYLVALSERLGTELTTDWQPFAQECGNAEFDYTIPSEYDSVEQLIEDKHEFLSRFYGSG